jgi:ferredoxin-thioredoxin reductase catalytic subunit
MLPDGALSEGVVRTTNPAKTSIERDNRIVGAINQGQTVAKQTLDDDWEDDEDVEPETVDEANYDEDVDISSPCPYCGKQMFDDTPRCPHCGNYISEEDSPEDRPGDRKPMWIIIAAVLCLIAALFWAVVVFES